MDTYGRIDHAVAGAGITEIGNVFDSALDMESIRQVRISALHPAESTQLMVRDSHPQQKSST
jgi:hypothetical protein